MIKQSIFILILFSLFSQATEKDPRIVEIRKMFRQIEAQVKNQNLSYQKREESDGYVVNQAVIYSDDKSVRKLHCEGGTGDSAATADCYYRRDGTIFFSFVRGTAISGCKSELRSYFDSKGRLIKRLRNDSRSCPASVPYPLKIDDVKSAYARYCLEN